MRTLQESRSCVTGPQSTQRRRNPLATRERTQQSSGELTGCRTVERLPVPLTEEELERVRRAAATDQVAAVEKELLSYRDSEEGRDALLHKALAAGLPAHRIVELSGVDPAALPTAPRS
ncbi:DUF6003 family protein [Streptomyces sp. NPDC127037]|uniref:DUF6003 family protein n=1 Tax=Streptomyces sp. NPDC127037 TaxID=3347113 RepID=UPI00366500FA